MTRAELLEKAKPILFNTEMVRAILDGRKTVTRRVVKPHIVDRFLLDEKGSLLGSYAEDMPDAYPTIDDAQYQVCDILYVRETWADGCMGGYIYKAGHEYAELLEKHKQWKPSIHMPKAAARIFLRVTDVRVERLQDITVEDAKREGAFLSCNMCVHWHDFCGQQVTQAKDCKIDGIAPLFPRLWNSTIKPADMPKYGWDANPWVWVYEFERVVPE